MVSVTARKIRELGTERPSGASGRLYTGYLISYPYIGRGMVIFRDPHGHRMITTPVKRVLGEPRIGAHGTLIFFVHPKDMGGQLTEIMETPKKAH